MKDEDWVSVYTEGDAMLEAAFVGDVHQMRNLAENNERLLYMNGKEEMSPLLAACIAGELDSVKFWLETAGDIKNTSLADGHFTPLHAAACCVDKSIGYQCAKLLMEHLHPAFVVDQRGWTPLHYAAFMSNFSVINLCVEQGCPIDFPNHKRNTALHLAIYKGDIEIVSRLIMEGADVNAIDDRGLSPCHFAAMQGSDNILQILLANGALPSTADKIYQDTPVHLSALLGHAQCVQILCDFRADVNCANIHGQTPLHLASSGGFDRTCKILLSSKASPNLNDRQSRTPLDLAMRYNHIGCIQLLHSKVH